MRVVGTRRIVNHSHGTIVSFNADLVGLCSHVRPNGMVIDLVVRDPVRNQTGCMIRITVAFRNSVQYSTINSDAT